MAFLREKYKKTNDNLGFRVKFFKFSGIKATHKT